MKYVTEAGKAWLAHWEGLKEGHGSAWCDPSGAIAAIEAEATAAAEQRLRAELAEKVLALPGTNEDGVSAPGMELLDRDAVLAILDAAAEPSSHE